MLDVIKHGTQVAPFVFFAEVWHFAGEHRVVLPMRDPCPAALIALFDNSRILGAHVGVQKNARPQFELVEQLCRKRSGFAVIFMSGYTEAAALENAHVGKDAILLNKPFSTDTLVRKITRVLEAAPAASGPNRATVS